MKRLIPLMLLISLVVADPVQAATPVLLPSSQPIPAYLTQAVQIALTSNPPTNPSAYYAITNLSEGEDRIDLSLAGFADLPAGPWSIDDSQALYSLTLVQSPAGLIIYPVLALGVEPSLVATQAEYSTMLPWKTGVMWFGPRGVHDLGFGLPGWLAVDWVSSGKDGEAPNLVYAAQAGEVSYVCRDQTQISIRVGNLFYAHLVDNGIQVGDHFDQGELIGSMVPGTFSDYCGWAAQPDGMYHLHWGFPGSIMADGWWLQTDTGYWVQGRQTVGVGQGMASDWSKQ